MMDQEKISSEEINDENEIVIVNPYNFNNNLLKPTDINNLLHNYDIDLNITSLSLYQQAFIHKSYTKKNPEDYGENVEIAEKPEGALELFDDQNERLEFLGDSVIGLIVGKYLFERYSDQDEGFMTRMKTKLVNTDALCYFAKELGFGKYMIISRHVEDKCNGRESSKILEDAFEAFIGAMFLDFNETELDGDYDFYSGIGFQVCETFIINLMEDKIDFADLIINDYNYKDQLLRYFQQTFHKTPKYKQLLVEGPAHDRKFTMAVLDDNDDIVAEASGKSKKKAEQLASKKALIYYGIIDKSELDNDELNNFESKNKESDDTSENNEDSEIEDD